MQVSKAKKGYKLVDAGFGKEVEIPEEWENMKIKDMIFDLVGGTPLKPNDFSDKGIPVLHKGDIKPNDVLEIGKTNPFCTKEFAEEYKSHMIDDSHLVITLRDLVPSGPAIGLMAHCDAEYLLAQGAYGFHTKSDKIDSSFLVHLSNSNHYRKYIKEMSVGSTQIHVRTPIFLDMDFWLPPLREQQQMSSILSNVDNALEKTNQLIEETELLKKGLMQKLLTKGIRHTKFKKAKWLFGKEIKIPEEWEVKTIKELVNEKIILEIQDGNHGELHPKNKDFTKDGLNFITADSINEGKIDYKKCKKLPDKFKKILRIGFTKPDDVILIHKASIGKCALNIKEDCILSPQATYYRLSDLMVSKFLLYVFSSTYFQEQLQSMGEQSTRKYIGILAQKDLKIILPLLSEQKQITSILSNVDSQINKEKLNKKNLELLKKGLMQKLLTGQIRVKI